MRAVASRIYCRRQAFPAYPRKAESEIGKVSCDSYILKRAGWRPVAEPESFRVLEGEGDDSQVPQPAFHHRLTRALRNETRPRFPKEPGTSP